MSDDLQHQLELYLAHAREALQAAGLNMEHGFYGTAINRAYYAIFYATSALLLAHGLVRGKHTGVIAVFRERFVKPGLIEPEYSDIYGAVMDARMDSDYEMAFEADRGVAQKAIFDAQRFVERIANYLAGEKRDES